MPWKNKWPLTVPDTGKTVKRQSAGFKTGGSGNNLWDKRVNKILKLSAKDEWRHCLGEDNPADIGSRGALGSKLKDEELWWKGPSWLTQEESRWPTSQVITSTPESQEDMKKTSTVMTVDVQDSASVAKVVDSGWYGT